MEKKFSLKKYNDKCLSFLNYVELMYKHSENDTASRQEAFFAFDTWVMKSKCRNYGLTMERSKNLAKKFYNDSYISNVGIGTDASTMINKLKSMSSDASITITSDGRQLSGSEKLGSGDIVKISNNGNEQSLRVVIYGDANGDGDINVLDLLKVQKHILNTASLSGSHKEAADANKDGNINVLDLLKVQKQILGTANIEQ